MITEEETVREAGKRAARQKGRKIDKRFKDL